MFLVDWTRNIARMRSRSQAVSQTIAGIAQLVEHDLAKVGVASSSLVSRSKFRQSRANSLLHGALAKRLCSGLQIRLVRFDSGTCLHIDKPVRGLDTDCGARVVKSVDTRDLKSLDVRVVPVRFRPRAPLKLKKKALQIKQIRRFIASFLFLLPSVSPLSLFLSCPFLV